MNISKLLVLISICSFLTVVKPNSKEFLYDNIKEAEIVDASFDPDITRSIEDEILSKEYQLETHFSITSDGFVLKIYRIWGYKGKNNKGNYVILLQHGLGVNSYF
jgi:hypothetical protein